MEDKVTIKIKYLSKDIDDLKYIDGKSDWIDLRSAETVEMKAGDFRLIPLGIAMALPEGYEAHFYIPQLWHHSDQLRWSCR